MYKVQRKIRKNSIIELENSTKDNSTKDNTPTVTGQVEYTYPITTGEDKTVNTTTDDSAAETGTVSPEITPLLKKKGLYSVWVCIFVCLFFARVCVCVRACVCVCV